ncbi:MAG: hypothetical protein QM405_00090 [Euryarchaeota archaeon]|nr:hypothetical protein [Euryarchaeota archaeon]
MCETHLLASALPIKKGSSHLCLTNDGSHGLMVPWCAGGLG